MGKLARLLVAGRGAAASRASRAMLAGKPEKLVPPI